MPRLTPGLRLRMATAALCAALSAVMPGAAGAQTRNPADTVPMPKAMSDLAFPLTSIILPGFGQFQQGQWAGGLALAGVGVAGIAAAVAVLPAVERSDAADLADLPKSPEARTFLLGAQTYQSMGFLSAYFAFRTTVPAYQKVDKRYLFLPPPDPPGKILSAPFQFHFLKRPTTFIPLGSLLILAGASVAYERGNHPDADWVFSWDDVAFSSAVSYYAGVSEEAAFRGYLLPVFHEYMGQLWVPANGLQSLIFAAAHYDGDIRRTLVPALLGYYFGLVTRRDQWSIRETAFTHFWWDAIALTASYLTLRRVEARIGFSTPF